MKKLVVALVASASLLALGGVANAQDQNLMRNDMIAPVVRIVVHSDAGNSSGSGTVIYSGQRNGHVETYILTNNHVVADSVQLKDKFSPQQGKVVQVEQSNQIDVDQFTYDAKGVLIATVSKPAHVVGHIDEIDLAVVELTDDTNAVPAATISKDDSVSVFDKVYAVGSGMGNPTFATDGIVSQTDTEIEGQRYLQVSSPIIFGNSGGALFRFEKSDGHYELIGVPARVQNTQAGVDVAMGYAIPASTVRDFLAHSPLGFIVGAADVPASAVHGAPVSDE